MKTQRCFQRKVRRLVAQKNRLVHELRTARALCRQLQRARNTPHRCGVIVTTPA